MFFRKMILIRFELQVPWDGFNPTVLTDSLMIEWRYSFLHRLFFKKETIPETLVCWMRFEVKHSCRFPAQSLVGVFINALYFSSCDDAPIDFHIFWLVFSSLQSNFLLKPTNPINPNNFWWLRPKNRMKAGLHECSHSSWTTHLL